MCAGYSLCSPLFKFYPCFPANTSHDQKLHGVCNHKTSRELSGLSFLLSDKSLVCLWYIWDQMMSFILQIFPKHQCEKTWNHSVRHPDVILALQSCVFYWSVILRVSSSPRPTDCSSVWHHWSDDPPTDSNLCLPLSVSLSRCYISLRWQGRVSVCIDKPRLDFAETAQYVMNREEEGEWERASSRWTKWGADLIRHSGMPKD